MPLPYLFLVLGVPDFEEEPEEDLPEDLEEPPPWNFEKLPPPPDLVSLTEL